MSRLAPESQIRQESGSERAAGGRESGCLNWELVLRMAKVRASVSEQANQSLN